MSYEPEPQIPAVREQLLAWINALAKVNTTEPKDAEVLEQQRRELLDPLLDSMLNMAMRLKHPGFREENEYRIATYYAPTFSTASEIGLIPRIELKFDPPCIKEVLIGPGANMMLRQHSVQYYLTQKLNESQDGPRYPGIEANLSKIPYRGD